MPKINVIGTPPKGFETGGNPLCAVGRWEDYRYANDHDLKESAYRSAFYKAEEIAHANNYTAMQILYCTCETRWFRRGYRYTIFFLGYRQTVSLRAAA